MSKYTIRNTPKTDRITRLVNHLFEKMPQVESERAVLVTESYKQTENLPIILRRSRAFRHILENIPIVIRPDELVVGSATKAPRSCQTFPEFSFEWLEAEFDTIEKEQQTRSIFQRTQRRRFPLPTNIGKAKPRASLQRL